MIKLIIPLFIPKINDEVDYKSLKNIILNIEDSKVIIGNNDLNNLTLMEKINIYLYLNVINSKNEYFIDEFISDKLIKSFSSNNDVLKYGILGNIFFDELKEYYLNLELKIKDESLNSFLDIINEYIIIDKRNRIEHILLKKKTIERNCYDYIDNLIGIYEI